ncbi:MAG: hypothetical protein P8Y03_20430 [Anaerolineales bacterium]
MAYHQDGIPDLIAGLVVLGFGTYIMTNNFAFLMASDFVMLMYYVLKRRITIPRFGYVRIDSEDKAQVRSWAAVGFGVLFVLLFSSLNIFLCRGPASSQEIQAWIRSYHMIPLSAMLFGLPALVAAIFLGPKRFYLYALLAVGLPAAGAWLNIDTYIPIMTMGVNALAFGTVLLVNFLKKYPLNPEVEDVNR